MLNRPTEIPQTDVQPSNLTNPNQKQKSQHGIHHIRCPILIDVPVETLTGITSYLDPPSLFALAAVNKYLAEHVKDDNTWRRAFVYQFLGVGPESDLDDEKTLLFRRTERSWRNEFIVRYRLRRRWERSRNVTTAHIPVHSVISGMHLMPSHSLLSSSIEYGIVARSLPLTGKILSGYLDASGTRAGLGIGNPNAEFTPNVSACAMASDGGTAKIVWGSRVGDVLFMNAPRAMETGRRSAADIRRCDVIDEHEGAVLDAKWIDVQNGWVLTGGADGRVKLWDAKTVSCVWTSQRAVNAFVPDPCIKVAGSTSHGFVVAVTRSGDVHVWTGFDLGQTSLSFNSVKEIVIRCPIRTATDGYDSNAAHGVNALHVDPSHASPTLLVAYQNDPYFYRIHIDKTTQHVETTTFGDPFFGSISVVVPFFRSESEHKQSSFVFVGDHIGCISLYPWDIDASHADPRTSAISPIRKFEAHQDGSSVTGVAWNGLALITGSIRGTTHIWDGLTFDPLRSFSSPVPRLRGRSVLQGVDAAERESVKHILVSQEKDVLFVGVGDRVMAWRAGPVPKNTTGGVRGRHFSGVLGKKKRSGNAKYLEQMEMTQTILESRDLLHNESEQSRRAYGREREQRTRLDNLGLNEVEAVEYVLMLSRDEAAMNASASAGIDMEEGVFEGDFDDDDDNDDDGVTTSRGSSRRPSTSSSTFGASSLSPSSSSSSVSSRSGMSAATATTPGGRPIPRVAPSASNHKVQVSPPYRREPMEAGPEYRAGTASSSAGSAASSSSPSVDSPTSGPAAGTRMHLEDHYFPPISASTSPTASVNASASSLLRGSPAPASPEQSTSAKATPAPSTSGSGSGSDSSPRTPSGSPKSLKPSSSSPPTAWSIPLTKKKTASSSNRSSPSSSAPRNAWAGPSRVSPPVRTQQQQRRSLASGGSTAANGMVPVEEMDDDLRFALELSLVEARSRGDDV